MSYKEKDVITEFTKGNYHSDCGEYNTEDLLDMFDETYISNTNITVNDILVDGVLENHPPYIVGSNLVVTEEGDNMFCYIRDEIVIPCSLELDYEFQNQSE